MRRSATAVVLATLVALAASAPSRAGTAGPAAVTYRPPVDAPVVDAFRPPANDWNRANRGLEYATAPGTPVAAAAPGHVVFAGPVAGGLHVVVLHDDGLRTSYSFLATISVRRGRQGPPRARRWAQPRSASTSGPGPGRRTSTRPSSSAAVLPRSTSSPMSCAGRRARPGNGRAWPGCCGAGRPGPSPARRRRSTGSRAGPSRSSPGSTTSCGAPSTSRGRRCRPPTPTASWPPRPPGGRPGRRACPTRWPHPSRRSAASSSEPAGWGSSSDDAAVDDVDAASLGYASTDTVRFSYRGGTTAENSYTAADTTTDIRESGRRLRRLLARIEGDTPGVPVDVVAHSQGGLVARAALTDEGDPGDGRPPKVNRLVTLGTPHLGAPVATGVTMTGHTTAGEVALTAAHTVLPGTIDPAGTSVAQMAEESTYLARLRRRPLPPGLKATSIGAREDLVVPAGRTLLAGANNVTVSVPGHAGDHGRLARSTQAGREIALALAGMNPTCQSFGDAMADAFVSEAIYTVETGLAGSAWMGARRIDKKVDAFFPDPTVPRRYE